VISSRFEVADGRFTGRIEQNCLGDGKAHAVRAYAEAQGFDLAEASFYTDSVSDRLLLESVGHPVAVNPDRELARLARDRGWAIEDWGKST
jgi:phosphoserine phosphatase